MYTKITGEYCAYTTKRALRLLQPSVSLESEKVGRDFIRFAGKGVRLAVNLN